MSADDETKNPPLLYLFDIVHYDTINNADLKQHIVSGWRYDFPVNGSP